MLFLMESPVSKHWRPWSDSTLCGILSGSALFAYDLLRISEDKFVNSFFMEMHLSYYKEEKES